MIKVFCKKCGKEGCKAHPRAGVRTFEMREVGAAGAAPKRKRKKARKKATAAAPKKSAKKAKKKAARKKAKTAAKRKGRK